MKPTIGFPIFKSYLKIRVKHFSIMFPKSYVGTSLKCVFLFTVWISQIPWTSNSKKTCTLAAYPAPITTRIVAFLRREFPTQNRLILPEIQAAARCSKWFLPMVESCDFRCGPLDRGVFFGARRDAILRNWRYK